MFKLTLKWDPDTCKIERDPPNITDDETKGILMAALKMVLHDIRKRDSERIVRTWLGYFRR